MTDYTNMTPKRILQIALMMDLPEILQLCDNNPNFDVTVCKNSNFWVKKDYTIEYNEAVV